MKKKNNCEARGQCTILTTMARVASASTPLVAIAKLCLIRKNRLHLGWMRKESILTSCICDQDRSSSSTTSSKAALSDTIVSSSVCAQKRSSSSTTLTADGASAAEAAPAERPLHSHLIPCYQEWYIPVTRRSLIAKLLADPRFSQGSDSTVKNLRIVAAEIDVAVANKYHKVHGELKPRYALKVHMPVA